MPRVQQTDPEVLRLELNLEQAIENDLEIAAADIRREIEQIGQRNLSAADTQRLLKATGIILGAYFVITSRKTRDTQVEIARSQVAKEAEFYRDLLRKAGAPATYANRTAQQIREYPNRVRNSFYQRPHPADKKTYAYRIVTVEQSAVKTVRNIVRNGSREGMSAEQMAEKIESYLLPKYRGKRVEPLKEARKSMKADKRYKPGGIRSGSIPYQAMRIARTESAETYRRSHTEMFEGTIFAGGDYEWMLSNSHPTRDICDDLAEGSPYKASERPSGHPNCMCSWRKIPPTLADVERLLKEKNVLQ